MVEGLKINLLRLSDILAKVKSNPLFFFYYGSILAIARWHCIMYGDNGSRRIDIIFSFQNCMSEGCSWNHFMCPIDSLDSLSLITRHTGLCLETGVIKSWSCWRATHIPIEKGQSIPERTQIAVSETLHAKNRKIHCIGKILDFSSLWRLSWIRFCIWSSVSLWECNSRRNFMLFKCVIHYEVILFYWRYFYFCMDFFL